MVPSEGQGQLFQGQWKQGCLSNTLDFKKHVSYDPCGNTGQGHQHRPQLPQDHRPRHGSRQQLRPNVTMAPEAAQVTHTSMVLVAARPLDINMASEGSLDPLHQHGL